MLCRGFAQHINSVLSNVFIPESIDSFSDVFEMLMRAGKTEKYNLIIDEFQEFFYINPAVYSKMQDIWDRYKDSTFVNFVASGSVYTLMNQILWMPANRFTDGVTASSSCVRSLLPY